MHSGCAPVAPRFAALYHSSAPYHRGAQPRKRVLNVDAAPRKNAAMRKPKSAVEQLLTRAWVHYTVTMSGTGPRPSACAMPGQRPWRWPGIAPALGYYIAFAGSSHKLHAKDAHERCPVRRGLYISICWLIRGSDFWVSVTGAGWVSWQGRRLLGRFLDHVSIVTIDVGTSQWHF